MSPRSGTLPSQQQGVIIIGTRGFIGVVVNGDLKVTYNHFDSYPDGIGVQVLGFLQGVLAGGSDGYNAMAEKAAALQLIDESEKPTAEQQEALKKYADTSVSTGSLDEWYVLLRGAQGNLGAYLDAGYMPDGSDFPLDGVFCEWGYLIDLDNKVFEVYKGFNKGLPTEGRWANRPNEADIQERYRSHLEYAKSEKREPWLTYDYFADTEYGAVTPLLAFPFADGLPSEDEFLHAINKAAGYDDETDD